MFWMFAVVGGWAGRFYQIAMKDVWAVSLHLSCSDMGK
jgi:hypothetical protein